MMNSLTEKLKIMLAEKEPLIIAIDGRCGSGKTTLAKHLASLLDGDIIHMDHFFLPPALRNEERVNVHYERFLEEVYPYLKQHIPFSYRIFDCSRMTYHGSKKVDAKPLLIIEGAYSLLPMWDEIFALRIFCDVDKDEQKERIIKRNGIEAYQNFEKKWIPKEEAYFQKYEVRERCDLYYCP